MSFPPNPQLGATHTVDRRLWTFNGEGWEQGRQVLSLPPEDPGLPLAPPPTSDPFWANVEWLVSGEGANGSTGFVDSSLNARTIGWAGPPNPTHTTSDKKFGTSSISYPLANNGGLLIQTPPNKSYGSSDFTVEMFVKYTAGVGGTMGLCYKRTDYVGAAAFQAANFYMDDTGRIGLLVNFTGLGAWDINLLTAAGVVVSGAWNHVAMQRAGSQFSLLCNGSEVASATDARAVNDGAGTSWTLGGASTVLVPASFPFVGLIDEARCTVGVARYSTPTYAVPTSPFPTS